MISKMLNNLRNNRTILLAVIAAFFVILAIAVGMITFQWGRQASIAGQTNDGTPASDAALDAATPVPTPDIVTNTPTTTPTPIATATPTPTPSPTSTPTPTPTPTPIVVITHVNALGRLETTEFVMRTVIDLANEPTNVWQEIFGSDQLMLVAEGKVVAGFDLDKVSKDDVIVRGAKVEITLPATEVLYSRIDNERTHVYQRETGLFVEPDKTLEGRARLLAEKALVDWAIERDIHKAAEKAGRAQIENLLRSLGFTEITINVKKKEL